MVVVGVMKGQIILANPRNSGRGADRNAVLGVIISMASADRIGLAFKKGH